MHSESTHLFVTLNGLALESNNSVNRNGNIYSAARMKQKCELSSFYILRRGFIYRAQFGHCLNYYNFTKYSGSGRSLHRNIMPTIKLILINRMFIKLLIYLFTFIDFENITSVLEDTPFLLRADKIFIAKHSRG